MNLPKMYPIRQKFDDTRIENIQEMVALELDRLSWSTIRPRNRVAITAGSRGISDIVEILGSIVNFLRGLEADPFKNILHLDTVEVSEAYSERLPQRPDLEIISGLNALQFNEQDNLT